MESSAAAILPQRRIMEFRLNRPQAAALTVMANETWLCWGRGTGKTQGVIAPWILHKVEVMPRSSGGLIGKTFTDLETKILQPLFLAFAMLGYEKDLHYVYGKKPPEHWDTPLTPIIDYSRVLSFPNGTTMELISLSLKGSANGKSLQWIVADEAKLLNELQLRQEVFPILRGHVRHFGASPWYGAKLMVTDKLSPNLHWILEKKKLMNPKLIATVMYYQLKMNGYLAQLDRMKANSDQKPLRRRIRRIDTLLSVLRKNLVYYGEASAKENIENLSPDYFENMARSLTPYEYGISIDNKDPRRVEGNFYSGRSEHHLYNSLLSDDDEMKPLAVALDYQASISPLVSCQINSKVMGKPSLNFLESLYVLKPLGLKHVVDLFCDKHKGRMCKHVYYFYDHTAVGERNMHKKFYEEVMDFFEANGWQVTPFHMGKAPGHNIKYNRLDYYLRNENDHGMPIRINEIGCASMVLSMDQTGTIDGGTEGTKKDKRTEKDKTFPQELSAHQGDTFDQLVWAVLELGLYPQSEEVPTMVGFR